MTAKFEEMLSGMHSFQSFFQRLNSILPPEVGEPMFGGAADALSKFNPAQLMDMMHGFKEIQGREDLRIKDVLSARDAMDSKSEKKDQ